MRWDVEFLSDFWWLHRVLQGLIWHHLGFWAWYVYVVISCVDVGRCWILVPSQLETMGFLVKTRSTIDPFFEAPPKIDPGDLQMHTGDNSCPLSSLRCWGVFDFQVASAMGLGNCFFHRPIFRGELLVFGRVYIIEICTFYKQQAFGPSLSCIKVVFQNSTLVVGFTSQNLLTL